MTTLTVKREYARIYGGERFSGRLAAKPGLHHGAWICHLLIKTDQPAVLFRLGHLEQLVEGSVDLLDEARRAGWSTALASDTRRVTQWTARERARLLAELAGHVRLGQGLADHPGEAEWRALQDNLGTPPDALERALFEAEFRKAIQEPSQPDPLP
ncbi:MAG: hypothetical protein HY898_03160 [Deltaproteobacteria bacterium]|nr:hypothetical protein [Deltaproteobacteria bacterium]